MRLIGGEDGPSLFDKNPLSWIYGPIVGGVVLLCCIAAVGFFLWQRKSAAQPAEPGAEEAEAPADTGEAGATEEQDYGDAAAGYAEGPGSMPQVPESDQMAVDQPLSSLPPPSSANAQAGEENEEGRGSRSPSDDGEKSA